MTAYTGDFRLGPDTGRVVLKTGRAGLAAKAGHDLTIEVTRWSARVEVPADEDGGVTAATVTAELDLGSLEVREGTGGAKPLTDGDRGQIKKQMENILGGATATFASSRIIASGASGGAIEGTVTLNGKTQPARLQVTTPGAWPVQGDRHGGPVRVRDQAVHRLLRRAQAARRGRGGVRGGLCPRHKPPGNAEPA